MAVNQQIIEILLRIRDEQIAKLNNVPKIMKKNGEVTKTLEKRLKAATKAQSDLNKAMALNKPKNIPFAGWAMSIMFFGMALQKTFDTIWKSSTKTFNDIMHSVDGTTTGFDMLEGSMKFLQFSVGEALEPLAVALVPIIDYVTDWIQLNPELTRGIVGWGFALGSIFMIGGSGVLAINGFIDLAGKIAVAREKSDLLNTSINTLKNAIGLGLIAVVGYRLFKNGTNDTPATTADWLTNLGLASIGGYMLGGPYGALAAFLITGVIIMAEESIKKAIKDANMVKDALDSIMRGESTGDLFKDYTFGWQGTSVPSYATDQIRQTSGQLSTDPTTSGLYNPGGVIYNINTLNLNADSTQQAYDIANGMINGS